MIAYIKKQKKVTASTDGPDQNSEPGVIMNVWINNQPVDLLEGMTVRHALIQADLLKRLKKGKRSMMNGGMRSVWTGRLKRGSALR